MTQPDFLSLGPGGTARRTPHADISPAPVSAICAHPEQAHIAHSGAPNLGATTLLGVRDGADTSPATRGTGLKVVLAPFDVILRTHVVEPDILVAPSSAFSERDLTTAPLLVVEVRSPSTARIDEVRKRSLYEEAGVAHYWLADPAAPSVTYAYCAAKFAVEGFMQSLAPVAQQLGIWVSVVEPAAVASDFVSNVQRPEPGTGPYAALLSAYLQRTAGAFANAQSSVDAAAAIADAATSDTYRFRWQTSEAATAFVGMSLKDLDGEGVLAATRTWIAND